MNKKIIFLASIPICTVFFALPVLAQDYVSGHEALGVMDAEATRNMPQWIKMWIYFMATVYISGVFFVKNHIEARWLVGGFILGFLFSKFAVPALGILNLAGLWALVHLVFWSPALFVMLKNRPFTSAFSIYSCWSGLATACILFSFFFDIRDACIYLSHILL